MGKRDTAPSGNFVKCLCALVVTAKRLLDELFMHYFHKLSSVSSWGLRPQTATGLHPWTPVGDFVSRPLICPPVDKNPVGVHGRVHPRSDNPGYACVCSKNMKAQEMMIEGTYTIEKILS